MNYRSYRQWLRFTRFFILCALFVIYVKTYVPWIPTYKLRVSRFVNEHEWSKENSSILSDNVTVVSAFFNLGTFQKGEGSLKYTESLYKDWMKRFAQVKNSMVIYLEDEATKKYLRKIRSNASLESFTKFVDVKRSELWAFGLQNNISKIFETPGYPKHHPNTVLPEYTCTTHAKFEVMGNAVRNNFFRTKYFIWMDVGYFRNNPVDRPPFCLGRPVDFDPCRIAFTEMNNYNPLLTTKEIVYGNINWVAGGFFVGRGDVMLHWVDQYKRQVQSMLKEGLMNTEQIVIYSMFNDKRNNNTVKLQVYHAGKFHPWFTLGYLCIKDRNNPC